MALIEIEEISNPHLWQDWQLIKFRHLHPALLPEANCFAEYNAALNNYLFFPQFLKVICY